MSSLNMLGKSLGLLLASDGTFEIHVQTGRVGFKRAFEKGDDPAFK